MSQVNGYGLTGGGGGLITTLTGNSGGPISPLAGNINVVGDLTSIVIAGNAGTHTLTASLSPVAAATIQYNNVTTTPFFAVLANFYLSVNTSTIAITINLPGIAQTGRYWLVKDRSGNCAVNNITVTTPGGVVLIDGLASYIMNTNFQTTGFIFNGVNYEIF